MGFLWLATVVELVPRAVACESDRPYCYPDWANQTGRLCSLVAVESAPQLGSCLQARCRRRSRRATHMSFR